MEGSQIGTEEFWVPAVLAAVSAGGQYVNQKNANQRENASEVSAIQNQQQLEDKANAESRALTAQIAKDTPTQIANQATGDYVAALRKNAAGATQGASTTGGAQTFGQSTSALAPAAGANVRYAADTGKAQQEVQNYGNTYANEMGQIDAATRQRQNEGLGMQTLGTNFNTLGASSYGQNFVDQLRSQAAGQTNPWVSLMSGLVGNAARSGAWGPKAAGTPGSPGVVPQGSTYIGDQTGATGSYA